MIVDLHVHLAPPEWAADGPLPPSLLDPQVVADRKAAAGIDVAVVLNAMMNLPGRSRDETQLDSIRAFNDFAATLLDRREPQFLFFTGANPFLGDPMLEEVRRAVADLGASGIVVNPTAGGRSVPASPESDPLWSLAEELDVPVLVHPSAVPEGTRGLDARVIEAVARPNDAALAAAGFLVGPMARHSGLRVVCAAGGGAVLAVLRSRMELSAASMGRRLGGGPPAGGPPAAGGPPPPAGGPPPGGGPPGGGPPGDGPPGDGPPGGGPPAPQIGFDRLFVDTCAFSHIGLAAMVEAFGPDRLLFGTDWPPVEAPPDRLIGAIRGLAIGDDAHAAILGGNARALLSIR